jgi:hypothetical protein
MLLIVELCLLLVAVVFSYMASSIQSSSYTSHKLWLGLPPRVVSRVVPLQVAGLLGYIVLIVWLDTHRPEKGLLTSAKLLHSTNVSLLVSQALWPHLSYPFMRRPDLVNSLLASLPLWTSAVAVSILTYGTFEAYDHPIPLVAASLGCTVVLLMDGLAWTSRAIFMGLTFKE